MRYCDANCQHDHWRRGHKQMCKKIHRGGNAEQYHADKKYKEAVAEAVEACAEDTMDPKATRGDLQEAKEELNKILCQARRVLGATHPRLGNIQQYLGIAEAKLAILR